MIVKQFPSGSRQIRKLLGRNLEAMTEYYVDAVREKISIQGFPIDRRSYEGEPPRMETRALHEGFHADIDLDALEAVAGSDQWYALRLQDPDDLDRPFFYRGTVIEEADEMAKLGTRQ